MLPFIRNIPAINSLNAFALTILQKQLTLSGSVNNNVLISPVSIYVALSMVYNGAANATQKAISETLQLHDVGTNELNETCKLLIEELPAEDRMVTIVIANAMWYNKALHPLSSFITTNKNFFHTAIEHITTAEAINAWIATKTKGKITNIINGVSADTFILLVNAIYFNANWQHQFKAYNTYTGKFYLQGGDVVDTKFMHQDIYTNHYIDTHYRIIELPYGYADSYSMYVIDGNNKTGVATLAAGLTTDALKAMTGRLRHGKVELNIPKWESHYSINDMIPLLTVLGMGIAFTDAAQFTNMYMEPALISSAVHKTYIKVTEEGTTAAAVTAFALGAGASPEVPPPIVTFDKRFLYIIAAKKTGAMLFTGIVNNPLLKD